MLSIFAFLGRRLWFFGRARRLEFLFFLVLIYGILFLLKGIGLLQIREVSDISALVSAYLLSAAFVRRLHDFDASGIWFLLIFVPLANLLLLVALLGRPGTEGRNKYGDGRRTDRIAEVF